MPNTPNMSLSEPDFLSTSLAVLAGWPRLWLPSLRNQCLSQTKQSTPPPPSVVRSSPPPPPRHIRYTHTHSSNLTLPSTSTLCQPSLASHHFVLDIHRIQFPSTLASAPPRTRDMAPIVSGSPFRPRSRGPTARSPSPPPLPPKASAIDLNSSTRSTDRETGLKVTKRAFLCDVVVERNGPETTALLSHLGNAVAPQSALRNSQNTPTTPSRRSENGSAAASKWSVEKSSEMQQRLSAILDEFIKTERSYVARIKALKTVSPCALRD